MNKAGSKIEAYSVITMEISAVLRSYGISRRTVFLKDRLAKFDVSARRFFVGLTFRSIFLNVLKKKLKKIN